MLRRLSIALALSFGLLGAARAQTIDFAPTDLSGYVTAAAMASASSDLGTYTVATLPTCSSGTAKKTAWASDLFGQAPGDRVVCDGVGHWKPVRPLSVSIDVSASNMTLTTLLNAPTQIMTGTLGLGVTRNVTLSTTNAYPGAKFCATRKVTGAGALSVTGLLGGLTSSLGLASWACFEFDGTGWVQTQSGGLL